MKKTLDKANVSSYTQCVSDTYDLYMRGMGLLERGDYHQAIVPLLQASRREPDKTSINEALGRAYFHAGQFANAAEEFQAVVDRAASNDFALFCLGRSLQMMGHHADACGPLALAATLRPERKDFCLYRDRARAAAGHSE